MGSDEGGLGSPPLFRRPDYRVADPRRPHLAPQDRESLHQPAGEEARARVPEGRARVSLPPAGARERVRGRRERVVPGTGVRGLAQADAGALRGAQEAFGERGPRVERVAGEPGVKEHITINAEVPYARIL